MYENKNKCNDAKKFKATKLLFYHLMSRYFAALTMKLIVLSYTIDKRRIKIVTLGIVGTYPFIYSAVNKCYG